MTGKDDDEKRQPPHRETVPSMGRRADWHDYRSRSIYMVTLAVSGRRPLLCTVGGTPEAPVVEPSALGAALQAAWSSIGSRYDGVAPLELQLMPDHLHGLLFFTRDVDFPLGRVVNGLKIAGNKAYRSLGLASDAYRSMWEKRYNDKVLYGEGQLARLVNYVRDNPRRLLLRRSNPRLFETVHDIVAGGVHLEAQGNIFLLDRPSIVAVKVSRRVTDEDLPQVVDGFLSMARGGAVLVSPSVSRGEKAVMHAAFDACLPVILVRPQGFSRYGKPSGRLFEACAAGRLLQVSQHPYSTQRVELDEELCKEMNALATALATD